MGTVMAKAKWGVLLLAYFQLSGVLAFAADAQDQDIITIPVAQVAAPAARAGSEIPFVEGQMPPEARAGWVWCLVTKPAEFKTETERVQSRAATNYLATVAAKYEMREEKILVEPERKKEIYVPAKFKTETVQELCQAEATGIRTIPAEFKCINKTVVVTPARMEATYIAPVYECVTEQVMVAPARRELRENCATAPVRRQASRDCGCAKHKIRGTCDDCNTKTVVIDRGESRDLCYGMIDIPAQYQTVTKQVLKTEGKVVQKEIAAVTKTVSVQELVKEARTETIKIPARFAAVEKITEIEPAHYTFETIPARYDSVQKLVMVTPESSRKVDVEAEFRTLNREVLVRPATMVWRLETCGTTAVASCKPTCQPTSPCGATTACGSSVVEKYGSLPGGPSN